MKKLLICIAAAFAACEFETQPPGTRPGAPEPSGVERTTSVPEGPLAITHDLGIKTTKRPSRGTPRWCAIADDLRTAFGCLPTARLLPEGEPREENGVVVRTYHVPSHLSGRNLSVDRSYAAGIKSSWSRLPRYVVSQAGETIDVRFPGLPAGADPTPETRVVASALVRAGRLKLRSRPVTITPGMILDGAIGLDPAIGPTGTRGARFRIEATVLEDTGKSTSVVLFEHEIAPAGAARGWTPYRIDLSDYAGRRVGLVLSSEPLHKRDLPRTGPVWAAPVLLAPAAPRPNVLLISLDTLRADGVGVYGSRLPTTPSLDAFAAEGAVFEDALTTFPSTTGSHMSLFTGFYPSVHRVTGPTEALHSDVPTLPQAFAAAGYNTAAFTENGMIVGQSGFARGFRSYQEFKKARFDSESLTNGYVDEVVSSVLSWLDANAGDRFFVFAHTYEVHGPYEPPEEFRTFQDTWEGTPTGRRPALVRARNLYSGEIRFTDREIGRLLDGLEERGLAASTIVVITSDHGEAFGDHGLMGHSWSLFSELLHVPLLIRAPGRVEPGLRIPTPVSLVDIGSTVLELAGLPVPDDVQGESLVPLLEGRGEAFPDRHVFAELFGAERQRVAAHSSTRKWIIETGRLKVYDRVNDPGDVRNVASPEDHESSRQLREEFEAEAHRLRRSIEGDTPAEPAPTPALDSATTEKLRALGYVD